MSRTHLGCNPVFLFPLHELPEDLMFLTGVVPRVHETLTWHQQIVLHTPTQRRIRTCAQRRIRTGAQRRIRTRAQRRIRTRAQRRIRTEQVGICWY